MDIRQDIHLLIRPADSNTRHTDHCYVLLTMTAARVSLVSPVLSVTSIFYPWYSSSHYTRPYIKEFVLFQNTQYISFELECILPIFRFYFLFEIQRPKPISLILSFVCHSLFQWAWNILSYWDEKRTMCTVNQCRYSKNPQTLITWNTITIYYHNIHPIK